MTAELNEHGATVERISALLDEALALADAIGVAGCGAHIADALHLLDPARTIALPPDGCVAP